MRRLELAPSVGQAGSAPRPSHGDAIGALLLDLLRRAIREELAELDLGRATTRSAVLDRNELAGALGISVSSLDRLRSERGFPELRIGEAPRFLLADVLTHLRNGAAK